MTSGIGRAVPPDFAARGADMVRIKSTRWTTERFKLASQAGCFHDMKIELVGGRLVEMTESPEHRNTVENLVELLAGVLDKHLWYVARESSVEFDDWTPLPDIAVMRGKIRKWMRSKSTRKIRTQSSSLLSCHASMRSYPTLNLHLALHPPTDLNPTPHLNPRIAIPRLLVARLGL
jgi:hypothetical protein